MTISSTDTQQPGTFLDEKSRRLFENLFDFFGLLDGRGGVIKMSGRIFNTTNTNPDLLIGQHFAHTVFWQSSANTARIFEKQIENALAGEHSKLVLDFRISADEKIALELNLQPFENDAGEKEIFITGQSLSDRASQLEHDHYANEQLLLAAENADIGLWFWDYKQDRIYSTTRCNELFELPGYAIPDYESFRKTIHPDDRAFVDDFLSSARDAGKKYEEEFRLQYSDGSIEWVCSQGKSILDESGTPQRMMGVLRNITKQKLSGEELARLHEREKKARAEAVEANRAKDFFLAFVSHELRSPLNAILGWSKILLTKKLDDETRKNALETIERSARSQTKLINDLVDSARVSSGKLRLEYLPTNLYEIVRNSYQAQKPIAETRRINFELICENTNAPIFGDSNRLQQVFSNLISNALKFTPEDGSVKIFVETAKDSVAVRVEDSGQGIDPAALPTIFQQFSQGNADQGKTNAGLGLGLSIVKILVTKHGGFVQAASDGVGKGSRFTVTLPLSDSESENSAETSDIDAMNHKRLDGVKILIVEDDQDSREVLQLFFQQSGAKVTSSDSAKAAFQTIEKLNGNLPDIIISDLAMPDEDGYSLIGRIRKLPDAMGGKIPALALSAFTSVESKQKAFDAGFDKYCTKPFDPDLLIKDVSDLIGAKD